jgi:hypothetical protein
MHVYICDIHPHIHIYNNLTMQGIEAAQTLVRFPRPHTQSRCTHAYIKTHTTTQTQHTRKYIKTYIHTYIHTYSGDPMRLHSGYDFNGHICGAGIHTDRPNLYYPYPFPGVDADGNRKDPDLTWAVCLEKCPNQMQFPPAPNQ